jgi:hypothetical protein
MAFDARRFMTLAAKGCASAARIHGFRTWESRARHSYANPFPEAYATAEIVRLLKAKGFRAMPEVVVREVLKKGEAGPGSRGKRGAGGRFDVTAWNAAGRPIAALELKWQWNSLAGDVSRLCIAQRQVGLRTFVAVLAGEKTKEGTRGVLERRIADLSKHKVTIGKPVYGRSANCAEFEGGATCGEPRFFGCVIVEIVATPVTRCAPRTVGPAKAAREHLAGAGVEVGPATARVSVPVRR